MQKYPQVPFPEGIFVKDEEKQEPKAYLCVVVLVLVVFCFLLKEIIHDANPKDPFEKVKCQKAMVTWAISNTGFVNSY